MSHLKLRSKEINPLYCLICLFEHNTIQLSDWIKLILSALVHRFSSIHRRVLEIVNFSDFKEIYEGDHFTAGTCKNEMQITNDAKCRRGSRGPVHVTLDEFENGGLALKTHQMFSVHTSPEKCKNATITGHLGFVLEKDSVREIAWLLWLNRSRKSPSRSAK